MAESPASVRDLLAASKCADGTPAPEPPLLERIDLPDGAVEVWLARLDVGTGLTAHHAALLSTDERQRAMRFHFERDRRRYAVARGTLRTLLAKRLGVMEAEIEFNYSKHGKPRLAMPLQPVEFNVSHAHERALFALSREHPVGADIEYLARDVAYRELAARFFSLRETDALNRFPQSERPRAFLNGWSRKEAIAKARGTGLSASLSRLEVPLGPLTAPHHTPPWTLYAPEIGYGYVASVVVWFGEE